MILLNCGVGEDFESPLDCKEIQPVHPKGDQSWVFTGRTDAKAETPILWPLENSREGTQLHPSTENWIKDLLSMAPPIRTRPSFPLSESLPSGSFHKPLILLHQRAAAAKSLQSCRLCATPETAAHQASPSLGFSRQQHWSRLPFPSPMHEREK